MTTAKQTFPAVTIEALPNGLFRLEDTAYSEGAIVDLHPAQVGVLASMVGCTLPDRDRMALGRLLARLKQAHEKCTYLEELLGGAFDDGVYVGLELQACEFLTPAIGEIVRDLEALCAPQDEQEPIAPVNAGGQLALV